MEVKGIAAATVGGAAGKVADVRAGTSGGFMGVLWTRGLFGGGSITVEGFLVNGGGGGGGGGAIKEVASGAVEVGASAPERTNSSASARVRKTLRMQSVHDFRYEPKMFKNIPHFRLHHAHHLRLGRRPIRVHPRNLSTPNAVKLLHIICRIWILTWIISGDKLSGLFCRGERLDYSSPPTVVSFLFLSTHGLLFPH